MCASFVNVSIKCESVSPVCFLSCIQMLGKLKQLVYLDVSKNNLEMVDEQICGCESLQDLLLSNNALTQLPGSIGTDSSTNDLWKIIHISVCILPKKKIGVCAYCRKKNIIHDFRLIKIDEAICTIP